MNNKPINQVTNNQSPICVNPCKSVVKILYFLCKTNPNLPKIRLTYALVEQGFMKMNPHFYANIPKAKFYANALIVSCAKLKGYEMNLDFWPKNPKAKTNPNKPNFIRHSLGEGGFRCALFKMNKGREGIRELLSSQEKDKKVKPNQRRTYTS